ncbi:MAG: coproporphyrinogen-III oxidase family protein [Conexibacter sp.]
MNSETHFKERLREFFYYPKLSRHSDPVDDPSAFAAFLQQSSARTDPFSLYIHVPFCDYLCHFCPFFKVLNHRTPEELKDRFFNAMARELRTYAESPYLKGRKLQWVEFGGGTPSSINAKHLELVLDTVRTSFNLDDAGVITMEGDALTLANRQKIRLIKSLGINRVSFGVQTFHEDLRRKLGLKPKVADLYAAVESIRAAGIEEFAIDLLYNLPDQTPDVFATDLQRGIDLKPDYVDLYSLTLWENTRFKERVAAGKAFAHSPTNAQNIAMFKQAQQRLQDSDYEAVRSYTYATKRPHKFIDDSKSHIRRRGETVGVGPSSRGYLAYHHYINSSSIETYSELVEAHGLSIDLGAYGGVSEDAHRLMVLFPAMLLDLDVDDVPDFERFVPDVEALVDAGMLWRKGTRIGLTNDGMVWAGNISRRFFSAAQKAHMTESYLYAKRHRVNPYNQDSVGLAAVAATATADPRGQRGAS